MPLITDTETNEDLLEAEQAKLDKKKQDAQMSAIKKSVVDPLAEVVDDFSDSVDGLAIAFKSLISKNSIPQEYFDKELSKKVSDGIDKISLLIQKLKPVDFTPLANTLASLEKQNAAFFTLVSSLPKGSDNKANETLMKEVMAMVQRNMDFVSKGLQQFDYTEKYDKIILAIENNKAIGWEFETSKAQYGKTITTATPKFKK